MADEHSLTKEQRILRMMKRVLTDIAKDTHVKPGLKHPLTENTIDGMRECLALITARENELAEESGIEMNQRPRFVDEPKSSFVVNIDSLKNKDPK